jgi:hypothetical protein
VESKSRKDYSEMLSYWTDGKIEPAIFSEAHALIGGPGYSVRDSASFASAIYSGIFCLLALQSARDWRLGENIQLQALEDHHIFPQAYLRRHGITKRPEVNSVANRTLISDETNGKIKDHAPAEYVDSRQIFPNGPTEDLLRPHFVSSDGLETMRRAGESLSNEQAADVYERFRTAREQAIVARIREACGVSTLPRPDSNDFEVRGPTAAENT